MFAAATGVDLPVDLGLAVLLFSGLTVWVRVPARGTPRGGTAQAAGTARAAAPGRAPSTARATASL